MHCCLLCQGDLTLATLHLPSLQHDDGIIPSIVDAVKKTVGNRKNPNGCAIPLTW